MRKLASIRSDLSMELVLGDLIESNDSFRFSSNGDLTVAEIVETDEEVSEFLFFNGEGSTVDSVGVNNINWAEGTWEFWLRNKVDLEPLSTSFYYSLFGVEQFNPSFRIRVYARGGNRFYFSFITNGGGDVSYQGNAIKLNDWSHVAFAYSNLEGTIKMFVDGKLVSTGNYVEPVSPMTTPFRIGQTMSYNPLHADMKEFRIWSRALSEFEVQENMNKSLTGNESDLVLYLPMNEGSGTLVKDKTISGNDGRVNRAEWIKEVEEFVPVCSIDSKGVLTLTELREG